MAEPAASQRGRISALLKSLPSATAFRLAEAASLFAPLAPLIDRSAEPDRDERDVEPGRIAADSMPAIWRWLSETAAPDAAGGFVEAFARAAFGSGLTPSSLQSSLPRLRAMLGREALRAVAGWSADDFAAALGSRRLGHDAHLVVRALSIAERLPSLRVPPDATELPAALIRAARELADHEHDARAVIAAYVLGQVRRTADATPLFLALARRRDEHRLDRSDLAPALNAAIEISCGRGAEKLDPDAVSPAEALEAALARARDVVDLAASLRGRVTDDWVRRLNARLARSDHRLDRLCEVYGLKVREALAAGEEGLSDETVEDAVAAAAFLAQSTAVAGTLRFEEARMRAVGEVLRDLAEAADTVDERLRRLAQDSVETAESAVELRGRVIGLFYDKRAGRAWARHGRQVIGLPSFEELVLAPFEPVIVDDGVAPLRGGLIARSTVDAFWRWTVEGPLAEANEAARVAHAQERTRNPAAAAAVVAEYRIVLADAARAAAEGKAGGLEVKDPRTAPPQLAALAALLACEREIQTRLEAWPPRLKHVAEAHVAEVRALHDTLATERPEVEPSMLILVMARLERPWQALRMLERIAKTNSDVLVEATEFSAIGELLIDWAEADAACFRISFSEPFVADRTLAALERFAGIASGMTEEFQIRRNGAWGGRLYALKARAARHLEEICKAAVEAVEAATPRITQHNGSWSADLSKPVDGYTFSSAAQYARFLRGSKVLDHRAAFAGARSAAMARIEGRLSAHVESLLDFAHAGEARDEALAALREIAVVLGEFEGAQSRDVLLRRVAAA
jgi:hypothetical protein